MAAQTPYNSLPPSTRWSKAVASLPRDQVDPVVAFPFKITAHDRVATGGSCFAQNIAAHLKRSGYNYYVTEDGHPLAPEDLKREFSYGVYSARYANIYTSRQLKQLMQRAFEGLEPVETIWGTPEGTFKDPLRPEIQPNGFSTPEELRADRSFHLKCVRRMFETLDYFVFTLGLTEFWRDKRDGIAFPVCPGVSGGLFDPEIFEFVNLSVGDVSQDLHFVVDLLRRVNPNAKVILTVSPVPLIATARAQSHVLSSTTYSKSVLRVVCEEVSATCDNVAYFPSYEIITGNYSRGAYYADDLRSVTEAGVEHVMRCFFKHATERAPENNTYVEETKQDESFALAARVAEVLCEEELIETSLRRTS